MKKFLIVLILTTVLFSPILFAGRIFANGDLLNLIYPGYEFYHSALKNGESFLWNPYVLGGFPFSASILGTFSPTFFLAFKYFSTITAYHLLLFVNVLLGAFFMILLLKNFGLSLWAQILGAVAFVASGWNWVADIGIGGAYAILPLVFLLIWKAREKIWPLFAGAGVVGYGLHAVQYNWLAMILVASLAFALFLGRSAFYKFLAMAALGIILGLIQFLPSLLYSKFSARASTLSFAESSVGAVGIFDLPRLFLPNFRLPFVEGSESLLYFGVLPLFFALLAFGLKDRLVRFFAGTLVAALLIAIKYSPLFWLLHQLPIFSAFRGPSRWMFLGLFAASALAAFGLDRVGETSHQWKKSLSYGVAVIGLLILAGALLSSLALSLFKPRLLAFLNDYFKNYIYEQTARLPLEHYQAVILNYFSQAEKLFNFSDPIFLFSIVFLFASILVIVFYAEERPMAKRAVASIVVLNFIFVFPYFLPTIPRGAWVPESAAAAAIKDGRVFSFLPGFTEWSKLVVPHGTDLNQSLKLSAELLAPNINIVYKIPQADAYENLMPRRNARLLALLGSDRATFGEKLVERRLTPEEKAKIFVEYKYLLNILGVRYLTSAYALDESRFTKISKSQVTDHNVSVFLYENETAKPLLYFAQKIQMIQPDELAAYHKIIQIKDADVTVLECDPCPAVSDALEGQVELLLQKHDQLKLKTTNQQAGILVFSQNHLPGWQVLIDGQEAQIYTVQSVFMGLYVPAGEHEVEFNFNFHELFKDVYQRKS